MGQLDGAEPGAVAHACKIAADWAAEQELDCEPSGQHSLVVTLPGERRLRIAVSLRFTRNGMSAQAFVLRAPDENEAQVHAWLLRRNGRLGTPAFMIDAHGDVFLTADLPLEAVTPETVDALMTRFALAADESFNELLALGFRTSILREWDWRRARGESTANLAAFEPLIRREREGEA